MFESFIERAEGFRVVNMQVYRAGEIIARYDPEPEIRRNQYSVSKSFTAVAVGFAVQEGLLRLDERLVDAFSEDVPSAPCPHLEAATVRDLLTMGLGQDSAYLMGEERTRLRVNSWARYALSRPFIHRPGTVFQYSNVGPYLAGLLVQRRAGMNMLNYLMPRLFQPLDILRPFWETDPDGCTFGAGGLCIDVSDLMKFGLFCLYKGSYQGKQLLDPAWIDAVSRVQIKNDGEGYGYLFWRGQNNTYRADGKYGQYAIIVPDKDAVVAVNAECREQGDLLAALQEHVVGAL